jgi:hypothetical protein
MLMRFGRTCPDLPADLFFDPDEWHAAYLLNKKKPSADPPTLNHVLRLVAMLGGFLARKGDGEPGRQNDLDRVAARHGLRHRSPVHP